MKRKTLDLGSEVGEIRAALDGVRILSDMAANAAVPDDETGRRLPRSTSALLNVIGARLRAFGRALDGGADVEPLVEPWNRTLGDGGAALRSWTPEQRKADAERELRRVAHERRARRRR